MISSNMEISFSASEILPFLDSHHQTTNRLGFAARFLLFIRLYVFFGFRRLDSATHFVYFISLAGQERSGAASVLEVRRNRRRHLVRFFLVLGHTPMVSLRTKQYCSI